MRRFAFAAALMTLLGLTVTLQADDQQTDAPPVRLQVVEFNDLPMKEAARLLATQTDLNIVTSAEAGQVRVSLYLRDVTPMTAIESLCAAHQLWFRRDPQTGIVRIHTVREYRRALTSAEGEKTEVFTLLYPNSVTIAQAIGDLYAQRVQLSLGSDDREQTTDLRERFRRFDMIDERSQGLGLFEGAGQSTVLRRGMGDSGLLRRDDQFDRRFDQSSRAGTSRPTRQSIDRLEELTAEEIQALEDRLTQAPDDVQAARSLGLERPMIYVTVVRRHNQLIVRSSDEEAMREIRDLVRRLDVPTPLVLLEVKIMSIELGDGITSAFDFQFNSGDISGGFTRGGIAAPTTVDGALQFAGSGLTSNALLFQYVGNAFRARMQLLEDDNRVTVLATPLLLTANNEVSRLFVGEERPINRGFSGGQTIVADTTLVTPASTTIEFRPIGTTLLLTATINADRTVTMRILQETSSINPNGGSVLIPSGQGFERQTVDTVQSRTISGTVVAHDGDAIALGGLIEESVTDLREQVPVLGRIPLLGVLFRRHDTSRSRRELVIMLRPYVLNTPAESEQISLDLLEQLSLHPILPEASGTLGTHRRDEVLTPQPPDHNLRRMFEYHTTPSSGSSQ